MKIGSLDTKPTTSPVGEARTPRTGSGATPAAGGEESTTVSISDAGSAIAQASQGGSFDAAKVERIAQAIRDGQFKVNPDKIADKLIANAQDLLKRYTDH